MSTFAPTIPRRIIQTAKTRDLPPLAKAASVNLKLLHPDWEFMFFDDEAVRNFIHDEFPQYRSTFDSFPHRIQKYDFFRYLAVFRYGGFYFDLDVFFSESLLPLLNKSCVFPFEELTLSRYLRDEHDIDWEIGNYGFGAAAGHPFLAAIVDNCIRAQNDHVWTEKMMRDIPWLFRSEFTVLNTTGPGLITRTLAENRRLAQGVTVLYPDDVCDSRSWHRFGTYGVHLMEGSWRQRGNLLWRKAALFWESRTRRQLMKESRQMGQTRTCPVANPA